MCCIFTALALLGPRAAIIVWWLFEPGRWALAFDTFIVPFIGFLFFPLTTLMYVLVAGVDGLQGFDYVWLGLALVLDLGSAFGGAYGNRGRMRTA